MYFCFRSSHKAIFWRFQIKTWAGSRRHVPTNWKGGNPMAASLGNSGHAKILPSKARQACPETFLTRDSGFCHAEKSPCAACLSFDIFPTARRHLEVIFSRTTNWYIFCSWLWDTFWFKKVGSKTRIPLFWRFEGVCQEDHLSRWSSQFWILRTTWNTMFYKEDAHRKLPEAYHAPRKILSWNRSKR